MHRDSPCQTAALEKAKEKNTVLITKSHLLFTCFRFVKSCGLQAQTMGLCGRSEGRRGVNPPLCSLSTQGWRAEEPTTIHPRSCARKVLAALWRHQVLFLLPPCPRRGGRRVTQSCFWATASPGARQLSHCHGLRLSSTHSRGWTQGMMYI